MAQEKKPQLAHTVRQMFETRWAKYSDPHNLEWDFDDITDKWERHAWSAFLDLQSTEAERDELLREVAQLREALQSIAKGVCKHGVQKTCLVRYQNAVREHYTETFQKELLSAMCPVCVAACALLAREK